MSVDGVLALVDLHLLLHYGDLLDGELYAAELDDVAALNMIVYLLAPVLQAPYHEVHVLVERLGHCGDVAAEELSELLLIRGGPFPAGARPFLTAGVYGTLDEELIYAS